MRRIAVLEIIYWLSFVCKPRKFNFVSCFHLVIKVCGGHVGTRIRTAAPASVRTSVTGGSWFGWRGTFVFIVLPHPAPWVCHRFIAVRLRGYVAPVVRVVCFDDQHYCAVLYC